jgi:hypothetical protein
VEQEQEDEEHGGREDEEHGGGEDEEDLSDNEVTTHYKGCNIYSLRPGV